MHPKKNSADQAILKTGNETGTVKNCPNFNHNKRVIKGFQVYNMIVGGAEGLN